MAIGTNFSILLYFKFHLLAKLLQRDGYTLKTQYRNLAIFSFFFCHLWRLKPTFLEYIAFWRNFSRPWRKWVWNWVLLWLESPFLATHWKPNIETRRFFPFFFSFFSLVAIETNFCRIFFIFLISLFGEISPGKEPLPLLPTYGPISRLSSLV